MPSASLNIHFLMTLILVAAGVAIAVRWIRIPYSIALVVVGLVMGVFRILPAVAMTPDLILLVFLPALLFEASWNLRLSDLKNCAKPVIAFATAGVLISTVVIGFILKSFGCFELSVGLLFGAMVSATDPISVIALFKKVGVEKRLTTILEGESLLNDGTAVVLFNLLLAAVVSGTTISASTLAVEFLKVTIGGTVIGAFFGYGASKLVRYFDDHLLETTLTVLIAYGSYLVAEQLHVSPIIAVLVAGIIAGNYGSKTGMSAATRLSVNAFWEYTAFIAESLLFLLIGLQINLDLLIKYCPLIGAAILAILCARSIAIYGLAPFVSTSSQNIPYKWRHLLVWGGLRGSLCMAMALSLPDSIPLREPLIITTFGVALFTLLIQGGSMGTLVRLLKLMGGINEKSSALKKELGRMDTELQKLKERQRQGKISKIEHADKREKLEHRKHEIREMVEQLHSGGELKELERIQTERELLQSQKDCLLRLSRDGKIDDEVLSSFRLRIDTELDLLPRTGTNPEPVKIKKRPK